MRPDPDRSVSAGPFPGRDGSDPRSDQEPPRRFWRNLDLGLAPEISPGEYDDDAWM